MVSKILYKVSYFLALIFCVFTVYLNVIDIYYRIPSYSYKNEIILDTVILSIFISQIFFGEKIKLIVSISSSILVSISLIEDFFSTWIHAVSVHNSYSKALIWFGIELATTLALLALFITIAIGSYLEYKKFPE